MTTAVSKERKFLFSYHMFFIILHNCICAYLFSPIPLGSIYVYITILDKKEKISIYFRELIGIRVKQRKFEFDIWLRGVFFISWLIDNLIKMMNILLLFYIVSISFNFLLIVQLYISSCHVYILNYLMLIAVHALVLYMFPLSYLSSLGIRLITSFILFFT